MCRLLLVKSDREFSIPPFLKELASISRNSKEYQGHGWGCSYLEGGEWKTYKNIKPIWEDDLGSFRGTTLLLAHSRSAFKDEGIAIENNMPFCDERHHFIFNGELRGVRIREEGRTGAEKIFNFIKRFNKGNLVEALKKATDIIKKRTSYIRAMNIVITDRLQSLVFSLYNEDPDYFTMFYIIEDGITVVCSESFGINSESFGKNAGWMSICNDCVRVF